VTRLAPAISNQVASPAAQEIDASTTSARPAIALRLPAQVTLYGLLFLAALPDAMVPPLLRELFVVRYGVSAEAAHWFMAINLVGAVLAVPVLSRLRGRVSPLMLLAGAAVANGILLALLALPIGFAGSMGLRLVEGAADLMVFAVLFDLIARSADVHSRGRRLGLAGCLLMFAIATGLLLGGQIGSAQPVLVFILGAAGCVMIAFVALTISTRVDVSARAATHDDEVKPSRPGRELWPAMAMMFSDRSVAGLLSTTAPLYFASVLELSPATSGALLGVTMLVMAVGSWPAGAWADRIGYMKLRTAAAIVFAMTLIGVPAAVNLDVAALGALMAVLGLAGAALMPTSLALGARSGKGALAMGSLHAAGNVGYFAGIALSASLLGVLRLSLDDAHAFALVIIALGVLHAVITAASSVAMLWRQ